MMTQFGALLRALADRDVEYIIVGGVAGAIHGGARATYDLNIVYARTPGNMGRLVDALAPHHPYLRGAPPGLPFQWDAETLARGLNFTLTTSLGDIDLLGEITGGGSYEALIPVFDPGRRFRHSKLVFGARSPDRRQTGRRPAQRSGCDRRARSDCRRNALTKQAVISLSPFRTHDHRRRDRHTARGGAPTCDAGSDVAPSTSAIAVPGW